MNNFIKNTLIAGALCLPLISNAQSTGNNPCMDAGFLDTSIVINGDFSAGNTAFTTTYVYCSSYNCLFPYHDEAYSVGSDAFFVHKYFTGHDHTTGTGNFMIVNGQDSTLQVWTETLPVVPSSNYVFSMWISAMNLLPTPGAAVLKVLVNGISLGTLAIPTTTGTWIEYTGTWYSGTSTTATVSIKDETSDWNGFDYGVDDISFRRCSVNTPPSAASDKKINKVRLSPNPSNGIVYIANCPEDGNIDVYDPIGKKVLSTNAGKLAGNKLDLSGLANGLYIIQISSALSEINQTERIVVNK